MFRSLEFLRVLEVLNLGLLQYLSAGLSATPRVLWMSNASFEAGKSLKTLHKTEHLQAGVKGSQLQPFS